MERIKGLTKMAISKRPQCTNCMTLFMTLFINIIDQWMGAYTTKSKSRKWTRVTLPFLLDTIKVNERTLAAFNINKLPESIYSFSFHFELANDLGTANIARRHLIGLSSEILERCRAYLGDSYGKNQKDKKIN